MKFTPIRLLLVALATLFAITVSQAAAIASPLGLAAAGDSGGFSGFLYSLIADHGMTVLLWVLSILGGLIARYVVQRIQNSFAQGVVSRAWSEIRDAVLEVAQTFVDDLKLARDDGKLTARERQLAKARAIETAKSNIGAKGLQRLARILGLENVDDWIGTKVESVVRDLTPTKSKTAGTIADPSPA